MSKTNNKDDEKLINASGDVSENNGETPEIVPAPTIYSYLVLFLILMTYICNQWYRSMIGYQYSNGVTKGHTDTKHNIRDSFPNLDGDTYGVLSGAAFTIPIAVLGIFAGSLADRIHRTRLLGFACFMYSLMTLLNFFAPDGQLWVLFVLRFLLGAFEAASNPAAYSLIADYFHISYRTRANAIYSLGIYIGGALSAMTIAIIKSIGWRLTWLISGLVGLVVAVALVIVVREPARGAFAAKKSQTSSAAAQVEGPSVIRKFLNAIQEILVNDACRWSCLGGMSRFWGGYSIGYYNGQFYKANYPDQYENEFVWMMVIIALCGGFISSLGGGYVSDYFDSRTYRIKAYVCIFGSLAGIPTIIGTYLSFNSFWQSILFLFSEYLLAECWTSPAITMVVNVISDENKGFAVGAYLFLTTVSGTIANAVIGPILKSYNASPNGTTAEKHVYGYVLTISVVMSYLIAVPLFWMAGKAYERQMIERKQKALLDNN